MGDATNAFIREIHGNTEARLFDEESLNFVDGFGVRRIRQGEFGFCNSGIDDAVEMLVDVPDAILPYGLFPSWCWQLIHQNAAVSVERCHLRGLFLDVHLREEIVDAALDRRRWIFVAIHPAVLVQVDPIAMVNALGLGRTKLH